MRGTRMTSVARARPIVLALAVAFVSALASHPPAVAGEEVQPQFVSRRVHLDRVGEVGAASTYVLNVECESGWEIRYSFHSETPVRFSIIGPSGAHVRAVDSATTGYSVYPVGAEGQYTLRWVNPSTSAGTDLVYNIKAVPPSALGDGGDLGGGGSNALTVDEVAIICIAGILASAFSMGMLLGAMYVHPTPWRRPGASLERRCLEAYSQAYGGGARPPWGPQGRQPR